MTVSTPKSSATDAAATQLSSLEVPQKERWKLVPEYAPQVAVLVAWPHDGTDWAEDLEPALVNFADMIAAISLAATPWVLIPNEETKADVLERVAKAAEKYHQREQFALEFSVCDYNDTWTRDYGPLTVFKASEQIGQKHLRLQNFIFNGWGGKFDATLDNQVNQKLWDSGEFERVYTSKLDQSQLFSVQLQDHPVILEGGSLETNGHVMMTTSACLLNENRNPDLDQEAIEKILRKQFGTPESIWLTQGHLEGDDTDAHVDTLARFVAKSTVVFQGCQDEADSHFTGIQAMKKELEAAADKFDLKLIELPWPKAVYDDGRRLPATYANFLVVNNHILLPTYNCDADQVAIKVLEESLPDMIIVPVPCSTLITNNGSLHCSTMQLPHIWTPL